MGCLLKQMEQERGKREEGRQCIVIDKINKRITEKSPEQVQTS